MCEAEKAEMGLQFANAAVSLAPHNCMAYNAVAACLARLEKYGEAIKIQQQALFYGPNNPSVHRNMAALYRVQGKNNNVSIQTIKHTKREPYKTNTLKGHPTL